MLCQYCGATFASGAKFCGRCGKEQTTVASTSRTVDPARPTLIPQTPPTTPSIHPETIQQALAEQQTRQQEGLAQLHREMIARLSQQYQELNERLKALEPETHPRVILSRKTTTWILSILALAALGFIYLLFAYINAFPKNRFDIIAIISSVLTIVGILYLAYDLLGRQHGPLLWLSHFVTCGLTGVMVLEPFFLLEALTGDLREALPTALIGGLLGAFSGLLLGTPSTDPKRPTFSFKSFLIGGAVSIAFWIPFLFFVLLAENTAAARTNFLSDYLKFALFIGVPLCALLSGFRHLLAEKSTVSLSQPRLFSWRGALIGFVIGVFIWYFYTALAIHDIVNTKAMPVNLLYLLVAPAVGILALASGIGGGFARFIFWWVNNLPERLLGAFGLILALIGAFLPLAQPIYNLLPGK